MRVYINTYIQYTCVCIYIYIYIYVCVCVSVLLKSVNYVCPQENAHFHIAEALISAFESMNWNRMMKKVNRAPSPERGVAVSSSSEEEGLAETRQQRVRIRKRDKMMGEVGDGET